VGFKVGACNVFAFIGYPPQYFVIADYSKYASDGSRRLAEKTLSFALCECFDQMGSAWIIRLKYKGSDFIHTPFSRPPLVKDHGIPHGNSQYETCFDIFLRGIFINMIQEGLGKVDEGVGNFPLKHFFCIDPFWLFLSFHRGPF
jgi:hypothetical protein